MKYLIPFALIIFWLGCQPSANVKAVDVINQDTIKLSDRLILIPVTDRVWMHVSYLQTEKWGLVGCNGMLYKNNKAAFIFDTPIRDEDSELLIDWLENDQHVKVKAVIVNHFHADCLGGLQAFHDKNIDSYGNRLTQELAMKDSAVVPIYSIDDEIKLGYEKDMEIINSFFGEAHTKDNIISWLPKEKVIFGGCMVKSLKSGKGNLADANVDEWANTIQKVKDKYPDAKFVIPGHGKFGDVSLLDYTIEMFSK